MISALSRKTRQLLGDPVLRLWLLRRIAGLEKAPPGFIEGVPPYLASSAGAAGSPGNPVWTGGETGGTFRAPEGATTIDLPGMPVEVSAENPVLLFDRDYPDLETTLGAHRFAWVPLAGPGLNPDWVDAIWKCWIDKFGADRTGWPWHAYTAAERAINIIDFANRFGLPGNPQDTVLSLARHAEIIRNNLEYFGDHYTSNHLSNNGRGLLRIGLALGLEEYADIGARIMVAEAGRIFGRSGLLNEGSSHYHLLITRNYIDAWLAAETAGLDQAPVLEDIAERAVAAIPVLCLPGGMPLIGDISPDAPPTYFSFLTGGEQVGTIPPLTTNTALRQATADLLSRVTPVSPDRAAEDGWHRFESGNWRALAYVPPDGWPPMPGHAHQDLGSFELHDGDTPLVVDPGRGSYADAQYIAAAVHNCLTIGQHDPAPVNRPYYDRAFRRRIVPYAPEFKRTRSGPTLRSNGFARVRGIGSFQRQWRFEDGKLEILDSVEGHGKRRIDRRYFTPADVEIEDGCAILSTDSRRWRLSAEVRPDVKQSTRWTAYGQGGQGYLITFRQTERLPFEGRTVLERL